jgi:drug/metabolite transporter (DMT)-like permease
LNWHGRPVAAKALAVAMLVTMGAGWGLCYALMKFAREAGASSPGLLIWEGIGSGLMLAMATLAHRRSLPRIGARELSYFTVNGLMGVTLPGAITLVVLPHVPVGVVALMISLAPIVTFALAAMFRIERPDPIRMMGILAGFAGVAAVIVPEGGLPSADMSPWTLAAIGSAVLLAAQCLVVSQFSPPKLDDIMNASGTLIVGGLAAVPFAISYGGVPSPLDFGSLATQAAAGSAVVNGVCWVLFVRVARSISPVFAAQNANLVTIGSIFWGMVIFAETPTAWTWVATACVALGVAAVALRQPGARESAQEPA